MKAVVVLASARKDGNTARVLHELMKTTDWDLVNLLDYQIGHFDYQHSNQNDDFLPLMRRLIPSYDVFIFATPVYWYAMSGLLKVFFDRLTDFLQLEKDLGRQLRGKSMAVISSANSDNLGDVFWLPFKASASYLGMRYLTNLHTYEDQWRPEHIAAFRAEIQYIFDKNCGDK